MMVQALPLHIVDTHDTCCTGVMLMVIPAVLPVELSVALMLAEPRTPVSRKRTTVFPLESVIPVIVGDGVPPSEVGYTNPPRFVANAIEWPPEPPSICAVTSEKSPTL